MQRRPLSIRALSFITVSSVAVASLIFAVLFASQYTRLQERLITEELDGLMMARASTFESAVEQAEQNVARLRAALPILEAWEPNQATAYLNQLMAESIRFRREEYNSFVALEAEPSRRLFGKEGHAVGVHKNPRQRGTAEYGKPENSIVELFEDPQYQSNPNEIWYQIGKRSKGLEITPVYYDQNYMKAWMVSVVQGIYVGDRFQGAVGIDILLDELLEEVERTTLGRTGRLMLVDSVSGMILTRAQGDAGSLEARERFRENLYDKEGGRSTWEPIIKNDTQLKLVRLPQGGDLVVTSRRLRKLPWTIIAYQRQSEMDEALYRSLRSHALLSIALIGFLVAVSYLSTRNLARPLKQLVDLMQQVKGDNLIHAQAPVIGTAETRELGGIFNHMIQAIAQAVRDKDAYAAKLQDYSQNLESRIEERTQRLSEKNRELESAMAQLRAIQQQLIQQEKLASMGTLMAGIAHELKNPLNFVNNFSDISIELAEELRQELEHLAGNLDAGAQERVSNLILWLTQNIERIDEHGRRADSIVRSMQMHSHGKSGAQQQWVELNPLIAQHVSLAYEGMRAADASVHATIHQEMAPDVGHVSVLPQDFGRAILNIVTNSLHAVMEKRKQLGSGFSPEIAVSSRSVGSRVEIRIRDNGTGIPMAIRDKIFTPFFTTRPTGVGVGLGLSIVHNIVVQWHQGELRVESEEGSYTEFLIVIPRAGINPEKEPTPRDTAQLKPSGP